MSQRAEPYEEPPRNEIPRLSRVHVAALESSDSDAMWVVAGMHHLVLRTLGRRSGREHKVALPYWLDYGAGVPVVVASFAGAPAHPAWYLNLADRSANPAVLVRLQRRSYWSVPEILAGAGYDRTWAALVADRPFYAEYQLRTTRKIPLVRLAAAGRPPPGAHTSAG